MMKLIATVVLIGLLAVGVLALLLAHYMARPA